MFEEKNDNEYYKKDCRTRGDGRDRLKREKRR